MPESKRDETKCFVQQRIERFHQLINQNTNTNTINHWISPPQTVDNLP